MKILTAVAAILLCTASLAVPAGADSFEDDVAGSVRVLTENAQALGKSMNERRLQQAAVSQDPRVYAFAKDGDQLPFGLEKYQRGELSISSSSGISPWADRDVIVSLEVCDKVYHDPMENAPDCLYLQFDFGRQLKTDLGAMAVTLDGVEVSKLFDDGRGPKIRWMDVPGYEIGSDGRVAVFLKRR